MDRKSQQNSSNIASGAFEFFNTELKDGDN